MSGQPRRLGAVKRREHDQDCLLRVYGDLWCTCSLRDSRPSAGPGSET